MVRYKTEPGEKEQKILAEISLNTPNNLKRRKVTSAVSAVLCVIYAAFAVWMFARAVLLITDSCCSALQCFFC